MSNSWLDWLITFLAGLEGAWGIEIYTGVQEVIWSIALNTWIVILHVLCRVTAANRRE